MLVFLENHQVGARPRKAFVSYSHRQEEWKERLLEALHPLEEARQILCWHDRELLAGTDWDRTIREEVRSADLVLLLVSPDFLASGYCQGVEIALAVERATAGQALLVPILVERCDWDDALFSKSQPLPGWNQFLAEMPDPDEAMSAIREQLALACIEHTLPSRPRGASGGEHRHWRLTVRRTSPEPDWSIVLSRLRQLAQEPGIELLASGPQVIGEEASSDFHVLILEGSVSAFEPVRQEHESGSLSETFGVQVVRVEMTLGATLQTSTRVATAPAQVSSPSPLLAPSRPFVPMRLLGLAVRERDPSWCMFLPHVGQSGLSGEPLQREQQRLNGYFFTALALPGEDLNVNLSLYEESRILPCRLAQTPMGRVFVEQDCLLKQFTASLLHPDGEVGREYWRAVREINARERSGDSPIDAFQKVWVTPDSASLRQKDPGHPSPVALPPGYGIEDDDWAVFITGSQTRVLCETDYAARSAQSGSREAKRSLAPSSQAEELIAAFREIVLPTVQKEVNDGEHFAPLRQVVDGVILAKWYRQHLVEPGIHRSLQDMAESLLQQLNAAANAGAAPPDDGATPTHVGISDDAPDWLHDTYQRYAALFRDGVVHCARPEEYETKADHPLFRVYFAGGIVVSDGVRLRRGR